MRKTFFILILFPAMLGCDRTSNSLPAETEEAFSRAQINGKLASAGFNRCMNYLNAWLSLADSATGLIPRNINDAASRDIWNAKDCAADNYPFMVLTSFLLDKELYNGKIRQMLETETRLTSRVGSLPDTYSFSKNGFKAKRINLEEIIFGSAEYVKDGLIPLTEWLGPSPWSERMISIVDDMWKNAPVKTPFGRIISNDPEVNGDMLQSLTRIYWMTGDKKYLEFAVRLGDFYLLGKNHPTKNFKQLKLRDHGCEIISGLCELYAAVSLTDTVKKEEYRKPLYEMLDRILETGRNSDGLFYNSINPVKGTPVNGGIADNFGYTLNGFYTVYLLDSVERYREPVIKVLKVLDEKYRNYPWEGPSSDGYADAIEGALNLYVREPVPEAAKWIDSEIKVMWNKQKESGIIEGWHGDGNFARTTIMYCLWKTCGAYADPWRHDIELGAQKNDTLLCLSVYAENDWQGRIIFDRKRHSEFLHLPADWPRINQFPEYFAVENERIYTISDIQQKKTINLKGSELIDGFPVTIKGGNTLRLIIRSSGSALLTGS